MKRTDTWMPVYVGDYLADTQRLSTEQHGAYFLLLLDYWRNGPPPENDEILCSITRLKMAQFRKHKSVLLSFFTVEGGKLIQKRVERERKRAKGITEVRSEAGKAGAAKRWGKSEPMANATDLPLANAQQNDGPSQLPSVPTEQRGEADLGKLVFDSGVVLLGRAGIPEQRARAFLAGLCRDHGNKRVSEALAAAERVTPSPAEPKSWLINHLKTAANESDALLRSIGRTYDKAA